MFYKMWLNTSFCLSLYRLSKYNFLLCIINGTARAVIYKNSLANKMLMFWKRLIITYWCLQSMKIPIENNTTMATIMPITTTTNVTIASSSSTVRDASDVGTYAERIVRTRLQLQAKRCHSFRMSGQCILFRMLKCFIDYIKISLILSENSIKKKWVTYIHIDIC